ncbi:hypothetical protein ACQP3L_39750, partial [Escherichia coli]
MKALGMGVITFQQLEIEIRIKLFILMYKNLFEYILPTCQTFSMVLAIHSFKVWNLHAILKPKKNTYRYIT